jgi:hypothetical protein
MISFRFFATLFLSCTSEVVHFYLVDRTRKLDVQKGSYLEVAEVSPDLFTRFNRDFCFFFETEVSVFQMNMLLVHLKECNLLVWHLTHKKVMLPVLLSAQKPSQVGF